MKYIDYILVGGGISGSVLAYMMRSHGADVHMYDLPNANMSSKVAAGLWNPLVLKRFKKVWRADECIQALEDTYPLLEEWIGANFYHPLPIRRIFHSPGEQNRWMELTENSAFAPYMHAEIENVPPYSSGTYGSAVTLRTGRINPNLLMEGVRRKLIEIDRFTSERFDWSKVEVLPEGIKYKDIRAHAVISCEGAQLATQKNAGQHGFSPVKGEVLEVQLSRDIGNECLHQKHFMLGEGSGRAFVGATYAWDEMNTQPTLAKKLELEQHVEAVFKGTFKTTHHKAGVRPATKDRRPLVGPHPQKQHTYIFGGMGSRAALMVPWLARELTYHLLYGHTLPEEVNPKRFA